MNLRGALLVGVLCAGLAAVGIGTTGKPPTSVVGGAYMTAAEQVGDAFTKAVILNDLNQIGALAGADSGRGSATAQIFGKVLGAGVAAAANDRAGNLNDYHWTLSTHVQAEQRAELTVRLSVTDFTAIAQKSEELMGYRVDASGQLIPPEEA